MAASASSVTCGVCERQLANSYDCVGATCGGNVCLECAFAMDKVRTEEYTCPCCFAACAISPLSPGQLSIQSARIGARAADLSIVLSAFVSALNVDADTSVLTGRVLSRTASRQKRHDSRILDDILLTLGHSWDLLPAEAVAVIVPALLPHAQTTWAEQPQPTRTASILEQCLVHGLVDQRPGHSPVWRTFASGLLRQPLSAVQTVDNFSEGTLSLILSAVDLSEVLDALELLLLTILSPSTALKLQRLLPGVAVIAATTEATAVQALRLLGACLRNGQGETPEDHALALEAIFTIATSFLTSADVIMHVLSLLQELSGPGYEVLALATAVPLLIRVLEAHLVNGTIVSKLLSLLSSHLYRQHLLSDPSEASLLPLCEAVLRHPQTVPQAGSTAGQTGSDGGVMGLLLDLAMASLPSISESTCMTLSRLCLRVLRELATVDSPTVPSPSKSSVTSPATSAVTSVQTLLLLRVVAHQHPHVLSSFDDDDVAPACTAIVAARDVLGSLEMANTIADLSIKIATSRMERAAQLRTSHSLNGATAPSDAIALTPGRPVHLLVPSRTPAHAGSSISPAGVRSVRTGHAGLATNTSASPIRGPSSPLWPTALSLSTPPAGQPPSTHRFVWPKLRHVFVDFSNVLHSGQKIARASSRGRASAGRTTVAAVSPPAVATAGRSSSQGKASPGTGYYTDPNLRIDVFKLAMLLKYGGNTASQDDSVTADLASAVGEGRLSLVGNPEPMRVVVSSKSPLTTAVEDHWAAAGFDLHLLERDSVSGKEQAVDIALSAEIMSLDGRLRSAETLGQVVPPQSQTLVLATGDGNDSVGWSTSFMNTVKMLLLNPAWRVEIWSWRAGLSSKYTSLAREHHGRVTVHLLDEHRSQLLFINGHGH